MIRVITKSIKLQVSPLLISSAMVYSACQYTLCMHVPCRGRWLRLISVRAATVWTLAYTWLKNSWEILQHLNCPRNWTETETKLKQNSFKLCRQFYDACNFVKQFIRRQKWRRMCCVMQTSQLVYQSWLISRGEGVGTPFPFFKCLRTPKYTRLRDFAYTISRFFRRWYTPYSRKRPPCLNADINFRLAGQLRSHCSCFTKRPLLSIYRPTSTASLLCFHMREVTVTYSSFYKLPPTCWRCTICCTKLAYICKLLSVELCTSQNRR